LPRLLLAPIAFAIAAPLCAEFLHIEQSLTGLDCISCAESVGKTLKKIKGVETASFRTQDSVAVLDLKPGNTVTLQEVRDRVKNLGYTPKGAKVSVRGEARGGAGKWTFRPAGVEAEFPLVVTEDKITVKQLDKGGVMILEGVMDDPSGPLKVITARRAD
jgi:copper chaperone CopZ